DPRGQRNGAAHPRTGALGGIDDLARRLVEDAMIVRPQPDADVLIICRHMPTYISPRPASRHTNPRGPRRGLVPIHQRPTSPSRSAGPSLSAPEGRRGLG